MRQDSLGRVAGDLISYVLLFRDAPDSARLGEQDLRHQLVQMLDQFSASRSARSVDPNELEAARFALAAWADETILRSSWASRDQWPNELLQARLFGTTKAGDEFYDRIARLPADFNQAREIYFLCLVNGFEGRLVGDASARQELIRKQYEHLRVAGLAKEAATKRHLSEPAYDVEIEVHGGSGRDLLPMLATWTLATVAGLALFYLALWLLAGGVEIPPGS